MSKAKGIIGPVQLEAKIHVINPDTGGHGTLTYSFPPGKAVTEDQVRNAIVKSVAKLSDQGFYLMGESTFFNHVLIKEKFGQVGNFAVDSDFQYTENEFDTRDFERQDIEDEDEYEEG